jgi:hypothetical protein
MASGSPAGAKHLKSLSNMFCMIKPPLTIYIVFLLCQNLQKQPLAYFEGSSTVKGKSGRLFKHSGDFPANEQVI